MDFESLLTYVLLAVGTVCFLHAYCLPNRWKKSPPEAVAWVSEQSRSLLPVLIFVWLIRCFLYEGFHIPSSSDRPTLQIGDVVVVNKYTYGLRLPLTHQVLAFKAMPKRGDIVVFRWSSVNPHMDLIKRVIGLPGDRIRYTDKVVYLNGKPVPITFKDKAEDTDAQHIAHPVLLGEEQLPGKTHAVYVRTYASSQNMSEVTVPENAYFVMGDNRDDSNDSRYWGFVPDVDLVGRADRIVLSWDSEKNWFRMHRFFEQVQ